MSNNWPNILYEISINAQKKKSNPLSGSELIKLERHQDECSEELAKIISDKLADANSSLSKYLLKHAKKGQQKVLVSPLRALSIVQYKKYWKAASNNFLRTNFLLSKNSAIVVKIKPDQNKLVISWEKN